MAVLTKITQRSLADNAVTASHVQADALAAGDIAAGAIGSSELADDAVGAAQLASNAVVDASVASGAAIGLSKLATTGALSATSLAVTGTITGNPKATNATTVAATYGNEQEIVHGTTFTTTGSTVTGDVVFESLTDEAVTLSGTGTITGSGGRIIMKGLENVEVRTKTDGGFTTPVTAPAIMTDKGRIGSLDVGDFSSGAIGSAVTGTLGSGISIGNDSFPAGAIIQVAKDWSGTFGGTGDWNHSVTSYYVFCTAVSFIPISATSKVYGTGRFSFGSDVTDSYGPQHKFKMLRRTEQDNTDPIVDIAGSGVDNKLFHFLGRGTNIRFDDYNVGPLVIYDTAHGKGNGERIYYDLWSRSGNHTIRGGHVEMIFFEVQG